MKIVIGCDPFAADLKQVLIKHCRARGVEVLDVDPGPEATYYEVAQLACRKIQTKEAERGILLCGTGAGVAIVANKLAGIVAVTVESPFTARRARAINDANVMALGAMVVTPQIACEMADAWLDTAFTSGLEEIAGFLRQAVTEVAKIDRANRAPLQD